MWRLRHHRRWVGQPPARSLCSTESALTRISAARESRHTCMATVFRLLAGAQEGTQEGTVRVVQLADHGGAQLGLGLDRREASARTAGSP